MMLSTSFLALSGAGVEDAHDAVHMGDLETLKTLKPVDFNSRDGDKRDTLLLAAVRWRRADIVNWILEQKSDSEYLEMRDSEGNTALMLAAYFGEDGIAESLLKKNADLAKVKYDYIKELVAVNTYIRDWVSVRPELGAARSSSSLIPRVNFKLEKLEINGRRIR